MVVIIGPTLASALLQAGPVDQIVLHVTPVLIGVDRPLYTSAGGSPIRLEKLTTSESDRSRTSFSGRRGISRR
jgi:riboflavin biosynthesis pyrimidine reductase